MDNNTFGQPKFDPETGQPLAQPPRFDPETGKPLEQTAQGFSQQAGSFGAQAEQTAQSFSQQAGSFGAQAEQTAQSFTQQASGFGAQAEQTAQSFSQQAGSFGAQAEQTAQSFSQQAGSFGAQAEQTAQSFTQQAGGFGAQAEQTAQSFSQQAGGFGAQAEQTAQSFSQQAGSFGAQAEQTAQSFTQQASGFGAQAEQTAQSFSQQASGFGAQAEQTAQSFSQQAGSFGAQTEQTAQYGGGFSQQQTYAQPYGGGAAQPQKKGATGLIIGIAVGVVALIGVVIALFATGVLGGGGKIAGYYALTGMTQDGKELSGRELREFSNNLWLVIEDGGKGYLASGGVAMDIVVDEKAKTITVDGDSADYTLSKGVLTITDDTDTMVFTKSKENPPEKPKLTSEMMKALEQHSGIYNLISVAGEPAEEYAGSAFIFSDFTVNLEVKDYNDFYDFELNRTKITVDAEGDTLSGNLSNGVLTLTIDGDEYVFARDDTQEYADWQEAIASNAASTAATEDTTTTSAAPAGGEIGGYYTVIGMRRGEEVLGEAEMALLPDPVYVVFESDGTGYMYAFGENEPLTYNAASRTVVMDGETLNCTLDGDILVIGDEEYELTFRRSSDPAPGGVAAFEGVRFINKSDLTLPFVYVSPGSYDTWGAAANTGDVQPDTQYEYDLAEGSGSYDLAVMDSNSWAHMAYDATLDDGYVIIFKESEDGAGYIFEVTDTSGNKKTLTCEDKEID